MSSNNKNRKPVKVGILEISPQNRSMLEFFFSDAGKSYFKEVSKEKASAYIIDYDSPGAKESWESIYKSTNKPGIIISIKEVDLPSTIWLQKPLTVKALKEAGESIQEMTLEETTSSPIKTFTESEIKPEESESENSKNEVSEVSTLETPENSVTEDVSIEEIPQIDDLISEDVRDLSLDDIIKDASEDDDTLIEDSNFDIEAQVKEIQNDSDSPENVLETNSELNDINLETETDTDTDTDTKVELSLLETEDEEILNDSTISLVEPDVEQLPADKIDLVNDVESSNEDQTIDSSSTPSVDEINFVESDVNKEIDSLLNSLMTDEKNLEAQNKLDSEESTNSVEDNDNNFDKVETIDTVDSKTEELTISDDSEETKENVIAESTDTENSGTQQTPEEELQSLLDEIRQSADKTTGAKDKAAHGLTDAAKRWRLLCGEDTVTSLEKFEKFTPSKYFLAYLIKNIEKAKQKGSVLRIKINGMKIVIEPESDRIYCTESVFSEEFSNLCYEPMKGNKVKIHTLDASEIRLYAKKMDKDVEYTHLTESFIWTTSLLTSRGRIPKDTNIKVKLGLTSWPNLTRVESFPHMMQIAALFNKNSWSLLEITKKSDIPKNYVVAFYNTALALGIIVSNGATKKTVKLDASNDKSKGFFSRILSKLST